MSERKKLATMSARRKTPKFEREESISSLSTEEEIDLKGSINFKGKIKIKEILEKVMEKEKNEIMDTVTEVEDKYENMMVDHRGLKFIIIDLFNEVKAVRKQRIELLERFNTLEKLLVHKEVLKLEDIEGENYDPTAETGAQRRKREMLENQIEKLRNDLKKLRKRRIIKDGSGNEKRPRCNEDDNSTDKE